eukprot:gene44537-22875_t
MGARRFGDDAAIAGQSGGRRGVPTGVFGHAPAGRAARDPARWERYASAQESHRWQGLPNPCIVSTGAPPHPECARGTCVPHHYS